MSKELSIETIHKIHDGKTVPVLCLAGSLDAHTVTKLEEAIVGRITEGQYLLVFDLSRLEYVSSAGMGLLIGFVDELRHKEGDMIITHVHPNVWKVFQILGFDKLFVFFDTTEAAFACHFKTQKGLS